MVDIKRDRFGLLSDGSEVFLYTVDNGKMKMSVTNYGACITSILLPAKNGDGFDDITLGYSTLEGYIQNEHHFGSLLGRVTGRIANAKLNIDGEEYLLTKNDGKNCLHGGYPSYDRRLWNSTYNTTDDNATIFFELRSPSGDQGLPGEVQFLISYTLTKNNEIVLRYYAKTNEPTFVNLTNHTYFNLNPAGVQDDGSYISVLNHELLISANSYLETDNELLPTGKVLPTANTLYDFTKPKLIKEAIEPMGKGLDTTYVVKKKLDSYKALACVLHEPISQRMLRVYSTQQALNVYTGNNLKNHFGKNGNRYEKFSGICLESQNFPDSQSSLLQPERIYNHETIWYFTF